MVKDFDISSLRSVFVAGERCDPSTVTHFESILGGDIPIVDHWWQTESGSVRLSFFFVYATTTTTTTTTTAHVRNAN